MKRRHVAPVTTPLAGLLVAGYGIELAAERRRRLPGDGLVPAHPTAMAARSALFLRDPSGRLGRPLAAEVYGVADLLARVWWPR